MKKRFMSALLCLCMLGGLLAATTFADPVFVTADDFDENGIYTTETDIFAVAMDGDGTVKNDAYKVEIVWGDMAFAWATEVTETQVWQPATHTYDIQTVHGESAWRLVDEDTALTLSRDADGAYTDIVTGTKQSNVLLFNHSSKPVDANVSIVAADADSNITPSISDANFGAAGAVAEDGSIDFALNYDEVGGTIYSKDNGTAAAVTVALEGAPKEGLLNKTAPTHVATVTVQLSLPENT